jgi:gliding motility-associated-like protein
MIKSKYFFIVLMLLLGRGNFIAQGIQLYNQVIGSIGDHYAGNNIEISSTVGELVVITGYNSNNIITQGFHQPLPQTPLSISYEANLVSCPELNDGRILITNILGCSPPYTVFWSNGQTGLQISNLSPGTYEATITGSDCVFTQAIEILNNPISNCKLIFYSGFTPNDDDQNNFWIIDNINLEEYRLNQIEIFNRWGSLVWSGDNYNNVSVVWKGNDDNEKRLPEGTYFYIMKIKDSIYKGYIELTR